jgi:hypothetical protein
MTFLLRLLGATLMLLVQVACIDVGHGVVGLDLELEVRSEGGSRIEGLALSLRDDRVQRRDFAICETDSSGRCKGDVSYRFSERVWRPLEFLGDLVGWKSRSAQPFHVVAMRDDEELASVSLGELSGPERRGESVVRRVIDIP